MHPLDSDSKIKGFGAGLAIVLSCFVGTQAGRAQPARSDPVEELRQALKESPNEMARRAREFAKKLAQAKPEDVPKLALKERERVLSQRVNALHSLGDLRRALLLKEWSQELELPEEGTSPNQKYRAIVAKRFRAGVDSVLKSNDVTAKLAVMAMLSERVTDTKSPEQQTGLGRPFAPEIANLAQRDPDPQVRLAAARALGLIFPDPTVATPALARLLPSRDVRERRAAAIALDDMIKVVARLANSGESSKILTKVEASPGNLVETVRAVVPVAARGLTDPDASVRLNCADAIDQAANAMLAQAPQRTVPEEEPDSSLQYQAIPTIIRPLLNTLSDQAGPLARAVDDSDPEVRIRVRHALESLVTARTRVGEFGTNVPPAPLPGNPMGSNSLGNSQDGKVLVALNTQIPAANKGEQLEEDLRTAVVGLAAGLSNKDVESRLAALDALEVMGRSGAPAVPALVARLRDPNLFVRWQATRILGKIGPVSNANVVPALAKRLSDPDLDVRLASCTALQSYGTAAGAAVPTLIRTMLDATDTDLRLGAMTALGSIGSAAHSAIEPLVAELKDPDPRSRQKAAEVLGSFGKAASSAEPELRTALNDENPEVRRAGSEAILNILQAGEQK